MTFPIATITRQHGITSQFASLIKDFLHPLSVWCSKNNFLISPPLSHQVNFEVLRRERLHRECSHWLLSKTQAGYQNVVDAVAGLQRATVSGSTLRYLLQVIEQHSPPFVHRAIAETSVSLERLLACIDSEKALVQNLLNKWTRASEGLVSLILEEVCMHFSDPDASMYSLIELYQKLTLFQGRVDTLRPSRSMNHLPLLKFHDLARLSPGGWLNDEVVNLFAHHWDRTGERLVVVLDSLFPTAYLGPQKDFEKEKLRLWKHNSLRVSNIN